MPQDIRRIVRLVDTSRQLLGGYDTPNKHGVGTLARRKEALEKTFGGVLNP